MFENYYLHYMSKQIWARLHSIGPYFGLRNQLLLIFKIPHCLKEVLHVWLCHCQLLESTLMLTSIMIEIWAPESRSHCTLCCVATWQRQTWCIVLGLYVSREAEIATGFIIHLSRGQIIIELKIKPSIFQSDGSKLEG